MNLLQLHKSFGSDHIQTNFTGTYNQHQLKQFKFRSQSSEKNSHQ